MKKCPSCKTVPLAEKTVDGATFHYCRRCQGVLFGKKYLNNLVDESVENLQVPKKAKSGDRKCPHCPDLSLRQFYYPQTYVTVDMCQRCRSIWLDAGELKEIELVRNKLKESGKLKAYVAQGSFKDSLLNFIDDSLKALTSF